MSHLKYLTTIALGLTIALSSSSLKANTNGTDCCKPLDTLDLILDKVCDIQQTLVTCCCTTLEPTLAILIPIEQQLIGILQLLGLNPANTDEVNACLAQVQPRVDDACQDILITAGNVALLLACLLSVGAPQQSK